VIHVRMTLTKGELGRNSADAGKLETVRPPLGQSWAERNECANGWIEPALVESLGRASSIGFRMHLVGNIDSLRAPRQ
jgi:hypothetical protein